MTQVLRMENDAGRGPFLDVDPSELAAHVGWLTAYDDGRDRGVKAKSLKEAITHPHHMNDIPGADLGSDFMGYLLTVLGSPERVGVSNREQFLHWFPEDSLDWFTKEGFYLDTYEVPEEYVQRGKYQLMFDASKAKRISRQAPNVLKTMEKAA